MGMVVNGLWSDQDQLAQESGEYVRQASTFRHWIGAAESPFTAQSGRYHLFVNAGCPWAYRTLLYLSVKNLGEHISVSFTRPGAGPQGWTFGEQPESLLGAHHMHNVYTLASPDFTGRATVPVLWDKQGRTIVNNESADIIRMLNSAFNALPGVDPVNYYPESLAADIDQLNDRIYQDVNNGVYRCGFAQSQQAYETAYERLFSTLDELDQHLQNQRFLFGDQITEADWRLFATLIRFDLAYYSLFKCNRQRLSDFEYLWPYTRDLYQQPKVAATVDVAAIKGIYFGSRPPRIIPKGPLIDFAQPHQRQQLTQSTYG